MRQEYPGQDDPGINHITKGSVHFLGEDLSTLDKEGWKRYRSNIGYIQQDPYGALPPS